MYCKEITPAYETIGKRRKLTGFIGALLDGDTVIHSMEYSTNSQAKTALNELSYELLMDLAERGLVDTLPDAVLADPPGDNPLGDEEGDECPDEYATCSVGTCIQNATHNVNGVHCCCFHYSEELTGVLCGCTNDDYGDAMAEQAMGSYNGNTWIDVEGMRVVAPTSGMVVVQIATEAQRVIIGRPCPTCGDEGDCPDCGTYVTLPLFDDIAQVLDMALNNRPAKDVIPELRRVKARLEAVGMSRIVALD